MSQGVLHDRDLVLRARSDAEAMDRLLRGSERFLWSWVWPVARKVHGLLPEWEPQDLYQVACIGLLRAVRYWDPDRAAFTTYASACVRDELSHAVRTPLRRLVQHQPHLVSLQSDIPNTHDLTLEDTLADPADYADRAEWAVDCMRVYRSLPSRSRHALRLLADGYRQREVAEALGVVPSRVSYIVSEARARMAS